MPCAIVSEEMSAMMLGRRTLQFLSPAPEEHWNQITPGLYADIDAYAAERKDCVVIEQCGTVDAACQAVERAVEDHGVKAVAVDYAQLLRSPGKSRYEQVTNTSIALRQLASRTKVVLLVLCQLSRAVEQRPGGFAPVMADLKDTGQLEQDADVISFLCWPHRIDESQPLNLFQFFNVKNRNRAIHQNVVSCRFIPDRQMILESVPEFFDRPAKPRSMFNEIPA